MSNNSLPLFPISSVSIILGISVHTLRLYEKEGLIIPFRKESGHRLYSFDDIERLRCIRESINQKKISIEGIKTIYSLIPCWVIKGCSDEDRASCKAFTDHSHPCWLLKHVRDTGKGAQCRECAVYQNYSNCKSIKENIVRLTTQSR